MQSYAGLFQGVILGHFSLSCFHENWIALSVVFSGKEVKKKWKRVGSCPEGQVLMTVERAVPPSGEHNFKCVQ